MTVKELKEEIEALINRGIISDDSEIVFFEVLEDFEGIEVNSVNCQHISGGVNKLCINAHY